MILVTGGNGFVGSRLCATLRARGIPVRAAVRRAAGEGEGEIAVGNLDANTQWQQALAGCASVIHLAARVHIMADSASDPLRLYREVNVEGSLRLAKQAQQMGVKRFVFVSSVKVNGESTDGAPFNADDVASPCDPYGQSKLEAEVALSSFARESGLELVIVRPVLVYGPAVKANFNSLMRLVSLGMPLPFGSVTNRRSIVALDNLVDLLILCVSHPAAPGQTFMVADDADLSVGELVRLLGDAMGKKAMLVPVPLGLMRAAAHVLGKRVVVDRLFGSLQVNAAPTRARLDWQPPVSTKAAIELTVAHFLAAATKGKP